MLKAQKMEIILGFNLFIFDKIKEKNYERKKK
jgi:hypothetical protein